MIGWPTCWGAGPPARAAASSRGETRNRLWKTLPGRAEGQRDGAEAGSFMERLEARHRDAHGDHEHAHDRPSQQWCETVAYLQCEATKCRGPCPLGLEDGASDSTKDVRPTVRTLNRARRLRVFRLTIPAPRWKVAPSYLSRLIDLPHPVIPFRKVDPSATRCWERPFREGSTGAEPGYGAALGLELGPPPGRDQASAPARRRRHRPAPG